MLGLVPVWLKDAQMLSLGKATGKDQGLPQYGTKLLYSASPITLHGGVGRAGQASVPLVGAVLLKKLGGFLVVECCYSAVWGSADFHDIIFRSGTAVPS